MGGAGEDQALLRWQARLLPFAVGAITIRTLVFFVAGLIQLRGLNRALRYDDTSTVQAVMDRDAAALHLDGDQAIDLLKWKTAVLLRIRSSAAAIGRSTRPCRCASGPC